MNYVLLILTIAVPAWLQWKYGKVQYTFIAYLALSIILTLNVIFNWV